jgi:hypothetical protein
MANLARVRTIWSGTGVVGPGVTTLYFDEAGSGFVANAAQIWVSLAAMFPSTITWTTPNNGDLIDIATGELTGTWTDGTTVTTVGTSVSQYAAGVGARIKWHTGGIRNGRRVTGSTFLVPLDGNKYDAQGTIGAAHLATMVTTATSVIGSAGNALCVYSKPGVDKNGNPLAGQSSVVTVASVPDVVSWLRSRRS